MAAALFWNLVIAAGLVFLAAAHGIVGLVFAWAALGIGIGMGLYDPAFAALTWLYGRGHCQLSHPWYALGSVAQRIESECPLLACCAARCNRAGPQNGALGQLS
jgi:hypothetical protein